MSEIYGKPNMMNAAWGGIASSKPPCISVSIREATLSFHNIQKVRPMLWGSFGSPAYYSIGEKLGDSFSVGNELKQK
jgi:hypothetical protein